MDHETIIEIWNKNYMKHVADSYIKNLGSHGLYFIRSRPSFILLDEQFKHDIYMAAVKICGAEIQYIMDPTSDIIEAAIKQWPCLKDYAWVTLNI